MAKYAPGGSSKKASGRAFNNAVNQLLGAFSFNGAAPLTPNTVKVWGSDTAITHFTPVLPLVYTWVSNLIYGVI